MSRTLTPKPSPYAASKSKPNTTNITKRLFLTSSFMRPSAADVKVCSPGKQAEDTYSRTANPTTATFAKRVAMLEGAEQAVATGTGMSAIQAALLTFLSAGDHLACSRSPLAPPSA